MEPSLSPVSAARRGLLAGPLAVQVAASGFRLEPHVSRAWGVDLDEGGSRVTLILLDAQTHSLRRVLGETRRIAVNATNPVTLESLQFKGEVLEIAEPDAAARAEVDRRVAQFAEALVSIGFDPAKMIGLSHPGPARRVVVAVRDVFEQTPGPRAGKRLENV